MAQTSTTGQLENIAAEMISEIRYTNEHEAPMVNLVEMHNLEKGSDTEVIPKVGQVTVRTLNEGEEMTNESDIGLTTLSVQTNEVGGYVVLTRKLLRNVKANMFKVVGRQFGDAQARLMNEDLVGLFPALNGGTDLGAAAREFTSNNLTAIVAQAKSNKFGSKVRIVAHPNSVMRLAKELTTVGSGQIRPIPNGFSSDLLDNFWSGIRFGGVPVFETGDIPRDSSDDAVNGIFDKSALGVLKSMVPDTDKSWKPRRRAWELVFTSDYIAFEIDDGKGAPVTFDALDPVTA